MRRFILIIILCSFPVLAQDNYCKDKESWKEWDELVQKYPHHMDIQMLHAVRISIHSEFILHYMTPKQHYKPFFLIPVYKVPEGNQPFFSFCF
jgi:hypothetical protein